MCSYKQMNLLCSHLGSDNELAWLKKQTPVQHACSPFGVLDLDYLEHAPDVEQSRAPMEPPPPAPDCRPSYPSPSYPGPGLGSDGAPPSPPRAPRPADPLKRTKSEATLRRSRPYAGSGGAYSCSGAGNPLAALPQEEALRAVVAYLSSTIQCAPAPSLFLR